MLVVSGGIGEDTCGAEEGEDDEDEELRSLDSDDESTTEDTVLEVTAGQLGDDTTDVTLVCQPSPVYSH